MFKFSVRYIAKNSEGLMYDKMYNYKCWTLYGAIKNILKDMPCIEELNTYTEFEAGFKLGWR